ncbi:MAG: hypothetical protein M1833_000610 [Piccolia ochrophora]|nr:MAG: hypothetical protein M1833_000610 [Piccolia ochrophora]
MAIDHESRGETKSSPRSFPFHSNIALEQWQNLDRILTGTGAIVCLNGHSSTLADFVAIARYGARAAVDTSARQSLEASRDALQARLGGGEVIYGVNTGFGGTANVRTKKTEELQRTLIRELHYGLLPPIRGSDNPHLHTSSCGDQWASNEEPSAEALYLPRSWVRAAIAIRINSLLKGCSGVRPVIVDTLNDLLQHDIVPMIPLRGSISASGDLSPLSYIGGTIQGKPTIQIMSKTDKVLYADEALASTGIEPVSLHAKEGLAIVNGTAISAATGSLALHDAHGLALLSQALTAMSVEALTGTKESFHPFFAESRPHPGQIESARNILAYLEGSHLTQVNNGTEASLRQDRYSIRTASQWVGPVLEDLGLAHQQMSIECNSATDNPLINQQGDCLNGGNFQARAVTSAMEKTRQGLQVIGRMLFTQCTEMINPATNRGLPPNLVAEDPSSSYIFKGTDLNIAALQAELGFLSGPMNHVQTAEMGNQSLNSLALISARYTHMANDVLAQLAAAHVVAACQALDLRALHQCFLSSYRPQFRALLESHQDIYSTGAFSDDQNLEEKLWSQLLKSFDATVSMDAHERLPAIAMSTRTVFLDLPGLEMNASFWRSVESLLQDLASSLRESWCAHRDAYLLHGDASPFLGRGSRQLYQFVRNTLQVPFLSSSKIRTPLSEHVSSGHVNGNSPREEAPTVGSYNALVYRAVRSGAVAKVIIDLLRDIQ